MTVGPTLGTGLFIGTGQALAAGGPASLMFIYVFISVLVYCLTTALAEVSTHSLSRNGTMFAHTYIYTSSHLGFAVAFLRWCTLAVYVPFEVTNAMVNLKLWSPGPSIAVRMGIVMAVIFAFNMLPDKIFRRSQALFTVLKFVTTVGLVVISVYLSIRGVPGTPVKGFHYWHQPGPFNELLFRGGLGRFVGLLECLLYSTISFTFIPELTVQRAERLDSEPGNSILRTTRNSNLVLFVLYIASALATTLMSPHNDPLITNHGTGAGLSPFVVGIEKYTIKVLPLIVTGLIFISSVASGRSFLHLSSHHLASMAESGHAPAMFMIRNRWNVPYMSVATTAGFSWLSYLCMATSSSAVFNYLMFFITTSGYISWVCSCLVYLRFRQAANNANIMPVHRSFVQPFGTYFALVTSVLLTLFNILQITLAHRPQVNPRNAIPAFVSIASFALVYLGHRLIHAIRKKSSQMDAPPAEIRGEVVEDRNAGQSIELQTRRRESKRSTAAASHHGS